MSVRLRRPTLIAVGGGSGSGKTTFAAALLTRLSTDRAVVISEDDYHRDVAAENFDAASFNFDDISVRDYAALERDLSNLTNWKSIPRRKYSFVTHKASVEPTSIAPSQYVIVEGIHILCSPLSPLFDLRVYIDVPDDIRLARRILRDTVERGWSPEAVVHRYLRDVRRAHYKFTYPGRAVSEIVVADSSTEHTPSSVALTESVSVVVDAIERILQLRAVANAD